MNLDIRTILATLSLERLRTLARECNAEHLWPMTKAGAVENLERCAGVDVESLLGTLSFDELAKVCRVLKVEQRAHRREVLIARLLEASSEASGAPVLVTQGVGQAAGQALGLGRSASLGASEPATRSLRAARSAVPPAPPA